MTHLPFLLEFFAWSSVAAILFFALEPLFVRFLKKIKFQKKIRARTLDGQKSEIFAKLHAKKAGTPTGGGVLIVAIVAAIIGFSRVLSFFGILEKSLLQRGEIYLPLFTLISVGILGAIDDFLNVRERGKTKGLSAKMKMIFLIFFATLAAIWFQFKLNFTAVSIPFFGIAEFGIWFFPFLIFLIVGVSNAVNFTDGLDGLAAGILLQNFLVFAILSFIRGQFFLAIFCGILVATLLAFLWFNLPPAKFFMGDAGALSLGATLAIIAAFTDTLFILPFTGFIFLVEILSVILQLSSKRFRGKKIFHAAPIHHHFEKLNWSETQIVGRFWILNGIFCGIGFLIAVLQFRIFGI